MAVKMGRGKEREREREREREKLTDIEQAVIASWLLAYKY